MALWIVEWGQFSGRSRVGAIGSLACACDVHASSEILVGKTF